MCLKMFIYVSRQQNIQESQPGFSDLLILQRKKVNYRKIYTYSLFLKKVFKNFVLIINPSQKNAIPCAFAPLEGLGGDEYEVVPPGGLGGTEVGGNEPGGFKLTIITQALNPGTSFKWDTRSVCGQMSQSVSRLREDV